MSRRLLLFLLTCLMDQYGQAQSLQILETGRFAIGFQSSMSYDYSRPAMEGQLGGREPDARALQINLWYPTEQTGEQNKMSINDYLLIEGANPFFTGTRTEKAKKFYFRYDQQNEVYFDSLLALDIQMHAMSDASTPNDKLPTVLLMHDGPTSFAVLAEYLASHGYVVINFPVFGSNGIEFDNRTNAVESEVRDIEFVLGYAKRLEFVDMKNVVLAGFSYGGLSITSYQMRHQLAKAIISFDTGITDSWGTGLMEKMPYYNLERLTIPMLHFWTVNGSWRQDLSWFEDYKYAQRHSIELSGLRHFDFTNTGLFRQFFPEWITKMQGEALGNYVWGYKVICQETLSFLNSVIELTSYIPGQQINKPGTQLTYKYFDASALNPSIESLKEEYTDRGIEGVNGVYDRHTKTNGSFSVQLFDEFFRFLQGQGADQYKDALHWANLFVENYPKSTLAHVRLATIHEKLSNRKEARKTYLRILELAPFDYALDRYFRDAYVNLAREKSDQ